MSLESLAIALLAVVVGLGFCFAGFRFFLILLPIWAFFAGLLFGADAITQLFGDGFLATVTGWIVGFVIGVVFAVLSYLFYWLAVVLLGATIGYAFTAGVLQAIGIDGNLVIFLAGIAGGVALALVTIVLRVPKYLVIVLTALGGATAVMAGVFLIFGLVDLNGLQFGVMAATLRVVQDNVVWLVVWGVVAAAGMIAQVMSSSAMEIDRTEYRYA
jgi:hypothetical protein